jgi:gluconolactonase
MNSRIAATRRAFIGGIATASLAPIAAFAQQPSAATGTPPSVITNPPRQWGRHAPPDIYPDPDVIVIDPRNQLLMTAAQSIYLLQVNTQGAAPG